MYYDKYMNFIPDDLQYISERMIVLYSASNKMYELRSDMRHLRDRKKVSIIPILEKCMNLFASFQQHADVFNDLRALLLWHVSYNLFANPVLISFRMIAGLNILHDTIKPLYSFNIRKCKVIDLDFRVLILYNIENYANFTRIYQRSFNVRGIN